MTFTATSQRADHPLNFVGHMLDLAATRPQGTALIVVQERDGLPVDRPISYQALDQRVRALAATLQCRFDQGERALLLLDNDDHYVVAFLACLYAGVIAVPVFPPESARPQHLARLTGIAQDAQATCVLATAATLKRLGAAINSFAGCEAVAVDEIDAQQADAWRRHLPADEDIAFLQYTSGSTSTPKGVMVGHGHLLANERAIEQGLGMVPDDVFVSWLPLYHDMGLIGALLQSLHRGIPIALMTPSFFLERPVRWLEAISRLRGTVSGGPDFAYRLCVERIGEARRAGLDLSCWRLAFSGAEPVRHDTLQDFASHFEPAGFDARAIYPCYGLAEATLFVTGGRRGQGMTAHAWHAVALTQGRAERDDDGSMLVACGEVASGHAIDIVDPQTMASLSEGLVGEVWASGPSVAAGYWQRPQETAQSFVDRDDGRWLRTGDLGFVSQGQLYITGRIKDLIILRGQNVYPQDIERAIESEVEAIRKGRIAAFAVHMAAGQEGVGVAVEVSSGMRKLVSTQALVEALNVAVASACRQPASVILLLNPGALPKTSSGKLQRGACREGWICRSIDAYAIWEQGHFVLGGQEATDVKTPTVPDALVGRPDDEVARLLAGFWSSQLKLAHPPAVDSHFFAAGGDSLKATQLAVRIAGQWGIDFPPRLVFEHARFAELLSMVRQAMASGEPRGGERLAAASGVSPITVIPDSKRGGPLPLSHAQARQWFLWQLDPLSSAYHIGVTLHIEGELHVPALKQSLGDIVRSHEALRTVFRAAEDGTPEQWIGLPQKEVDLPLVDIGGGGVAGEALDAALRDVASRPFDLTEGPLLRTALLRLGQTRHVLVVVMHHIVSDGASMQVFIDELAGRYAALLSGQTWSAPSCALQPVDHAVWQRTWLAAGEADRQLAWWRSQLGKGGERGGRHPVLALPIDKPRLARAAYKAARHGIEVPVALSQALARKTVLQGSTVFMTLLGCLHGLLHRWTGQGDVRVGVAVANRQRPELQGVIGLFVNTLVLRNEVASDMPLSRLMAQAREAALGAQAHQDLPFEQLVEALQPERSLSHTPLFQVMFNHLRQDTQALAQLSQLSGLNVQAQALGQGPDGKAAQFELVLDSLEQSDGSLRLSFIYAAELFKPRTIERLAGHYLALLQAWVDDDAQALGDVRLMQEPEQALLSEWCGSGREGCGDLALPAVHESIAAHARSQPDAIAVVFGEQSLSYAELDARAKQLAHHLIAQGVGRETLVGVALPRSLEMVVALLGILKAGGAWVPLDLDYPAQRLAYMAQDSGVALVLTQRSLMDLKDQNPLAALAGQHRLLALDEWGGLADELGAVGRSDLDEGDPHAKHAKPNSSSASMATTAATTPTLRPAHGPVHGEQAAYVIYTSGSTGRPKGAVNRHGALASCMAWMQATYQLQPGQDAVLHKAPFGFDVSVWEIFWPLTAGVKLVLAQPGDQRDPQRIVALIRQHGITTVNFVPSMLQAFLGHEGIEAQTRLRHIICGGEAMPAAVQEEALRRLHGASLQNLYGPTEATIHVTRWSCQADGRSLVPIGRPIQGVRAHVLDERLNPVAIGVAGELYLGGINLGRGYLGRPGLTAERFVADAQGGSGERLYRTGDLVRWNAQGQLEYLGRLDHQVKIRGLRIELGEVEAALQAQPGIHEAVVVAQRGAVGANTAEVIDDAANGANGANAASARLVAYVSTRQPIDTSKLRQALLQSLPDYMVPQVIVVMDALPLNANGKVDRQALPAVEAHAGGPNGEDPQATSEPPQGEIEQALATIWAQVLGLQPERIGRHDNFFDIGGHSLLAVRITTLMARHHGCQIAVKQLFALPSVHALAAHIADQGQFHHAGERTASLLEMDRLLNEFEV